MYLTSLQLITSNRLLYSDLCLSFYRLMEALAQFAFQYVFNFPQQEQQMLVDTILWGCMDKERHIYESSLQTMLRILQAVRCSDTAFRQAFYQSFLVYLLEHTLYGWLGGKIVETA